MKKLLIGLMLLTGCVTAGVAPTVTVTGTEPYEEHLVGQDFKIKNDNNFLVVYEIHCSAWTLGAAGTHFGHIEAKSEVEGAILVADEYQAADGGIQKVDLTKPQCTIVKWMKWK